MIPSRVRQRSRWASICPVMTERDTSPKPWPGPSVSERCRLLASLLLDLPLDRRVELALSVWGECAVGARRAICAVGTNAAFAVCAVAITRTQLADMTLRLRGGESWCNHTLNHGQHQSRTSNDSDPADEAPPAKAGCIGIPSLIA